MPDIAILAFDNCQPTAIASLTEAMTVANLHRRLASPDEPPPFSWRVLSERGAPVRAMGGLTLAADGAFDEADAPDLIFVPAILSDDPDRMQRQIDRMHRQTGDMLRAHHARGGYLAANCSAVFLLAETGLLNGRAATTSWWLSRRFRGRYRKIRFQPEALTTRDERLLCAASFSACLNLGVGIVETFLGPRAALSCARVMLVDVNRTTQLPYANLGARPGHGDELVLRAQTILLSGLHDPADLAALADRLGVTPRTLARRFGAAIGETPLEFLQKARVEHAKRLLESTTTSIDEIAHQVGYADTSAFRRLFRRVAGIPPGDYRRRLGLAGPPVGD